MIEICFTIYIICVPIVDYHVECYFHSESRHWRTTKGLVAPIFKKGNRGLAENYRPVSLTCITCKLFEHIVCRHILNHVEDHKILTNLQHGFRSGRSCETQLITTTHDLLSSFNSKSQIDVAIIDFSKAFDTVPHAGLLGKLEHYGIDSKILLWITNFLNNRKQRVVVDGSFSNFKSYESDRHTCHTKISTTQGLTAKFCVNLLSINITI